MSIWFRIPANRETAFKNAYLGESVRGKDNPNEDEKAALIANADGTMLMTGSSRVSAAAATRLANASPPWLEVFDHWPPTLGEGEWKPKR
mgnify:CR=1 FL=1